MCAKGQSIRICDFRASDLLPSRASCNSPEFLRNCGAVLRGAAGAGADGRGCFRGVGRADVSRRRQHCRMEGNADRSHFLRAMLERNLPAVWEWFDYRRGVLETFEPNPAHYEIARWQERFAGADAGHAERRRAASEAPDRATSSNCMGTSGGRAVRFAGWATRCRRARGRMRVWSAGTRCGRTLSCLARCCRPARLNLRQARRRNAIFVL